MHRIGFFGARWRIHPSLAPQAESKTPITSPGGVPHAGQPAFWIKTPVHMGNIRLSRLVGPHEVNGKYIMAIVREKLSELEQVELPGAISIRPELRFSAGKRTAK
uniref:Uncharacterized protein n=1 Tax=mine drainage metagenome TaxID=410659 RepID=E6Q533_9ZZZZ